MSDSSSQPQPPLSQPHEPPPNTEWIEIIVPATAQSVDDVAALVVDEVAAARAGVELRGHLVVFWTSAPEAESALAAARAAASMWTAAGIEVSADQIIARPAVPETEWRDAWKKHFHIVRLTRQLVVVPSWEKDAYRAAPDDLPLWLDPGMAFGTGAHASTQLVLEEMQTHKDAGANPRTVLDVGAGSGILSLAALRFFPGATCVAIDNDPLAIAACAENSLANHLEFSARLAPLGDGDQADLVLANIQAHVLRELKAALWHACRPNATLVLSGILTPQAPPLVDEFCALGLTLVRTRQSHDEQWTAIVLRR